MGRVSPGIIGVSGSIFTVSGWELIYIYLVKCYSWLSAVGQPSVFSRLGRGTDGPGRPVDGGCCSEPCLAGTDLANSTMSNNNTNFAALILSDNDRLRLRALAPAFGYSLTSTNDGQLVIRDEITNDVFVLPESKAWLRLLSELCGRSAPWLCFRIGTSCRDTFLGISDAKLLRVAELYRGWLASLHQRSSGEPGCAGVPKSRKRATPAAVA